MKQVRVDPMPRFVAGGRLLNAPANLTPFGLPDEYVGTAIINVPSECERLVLLQGLGTIYERQWGKGSLEYLTQR